MARMLFSSAGGSGHLEPLAPLAGAAVAAGHAVAVATRPWMVSRAEALGVQAFAAGSDLGLAPRRRPLALLDVEREIRAVGPGFGRRIARERAVDLLPLCASWRPDLLVSEELDYGAMLVAERLGLPHATVLVSAAGSFVRPEVVAGPLDEVRAEHGLPPDPGLAMPGRHLVLSPFPPSFRDPGVPLPATARSFRPFAPEAAGSEEPPPWLTHLGDGPVVYLTLGTVFNMESGDLFHRVLAGLRELPVRVVVTLGRDLDPAELGRQPAHVRVERFVPQAELLPFCDLVVSHGGSGSVMGALAHGLPLVLLPMGADHPLNAARCEALGVGCTLDAVAASPEDVRDTVSGVLADPAHRLAAGRIRDELAALPGPESALALLEQLVAGRVARR
jgi:UDP:flavonoid glycosyltransferase YjiC (YdhE family)